MWKFADDNKQEISKEKTIEYLEKGKYENLFQSEYKLYRRSDMLFYLYQWKWCTDFMFRKIKK